MLGQFQFLDDEVCWPRGGGPWTIVEVNFGHSTAWDLRLELEREGQAAQVVFADPVSFRVHDEGELLTYWVARDAQGVDIGTFYSLENSIVLQEFIHEVGGSKPLRHFLVAGSDTCVEVLGVQPPEVTT